MQISRKSRELQNEIAASYLDDLINSLVTKVSGMQSTCIEMPKNKQKTKMFFFSAKILGENCQLLVLMEGEGLFHITAVFEPLTKCNTCVRPSLVSTQSRSWVWATDWQGYFIHLKFESLDNEANYEYNHHRRFSPTEEHMVKRKQLKGTYSQCVVGWVG